MYYIKTFIIIIVKFAYIILYSTACMVSMARVSVAGKTVQAYRIVYTA